MPSLEKKMLGKAFAKVRDLVGLNVRDAAAKIGISYQRLGAMEQGEIGPHSVDKLTKVYKSLGWDGKMPAVTEEEVIGVERRASPDESSPSPRVEALIGAAQATVLHLLENHAADGPLVGLANELATAGGRLLSGLPPEAVQRVRQIARGIVQRYAGNGQVVSKPKKRSVSP